MMSECSACDTDELSFYYIRLIKVINKAVKCYFEVL